MEKELISVIVPCYNVSNFLEDCYISLKNQTYENFEVIFVNDGSKDDTLQKIKSYCEDSTKFRYIDQENKGLSGARNTGIAESKGKYLCFIDSDDAISPRFLENMYFAIKRNDADFATCTRKFTKETFSSKTDIKIEKVKSKDVIVEGTENLLVQLLSTKLFTFSTCNKLYKKDMIEKMPNFPNVFDRQIRYGEDIDFNIRLFTLCKKGVHAKDSIYYYRTRKGSLVHSKFNENMMTLFIGHRRNAELCEKDYPKGAQYIKAYICIACVEMLFRMYSSKYTNSDAVVQCYKELKSTINPLMKSIKIQWYKRLIPLAVPILRVLLWKHFRNVKLDKENIK